MYDVRNMKRKIKKAFSLVELMIMVAILGILAAVVVPTLQGHISLAKEAAAKDNLRILRNAIELYAVRHNGVPPGYPNDDPTGFPTSVNFVWRISMADKYVNKIPENPFNGLKAVRVIGNNDEFPSDPTGLFGWVYQPAAKIIRLDWTGVDKDGIRYYDY